MYIVIPQWGCTWHKHKAQIRNDAVERVPIMCFSYVLSPIPLIAINQLQFLGKNRSKKRKGDRVVTQWVPSYKLEMASVLRNVKVLPNSASVEEARQRVFEFFRVACRSLPSVMEIYNLYDVTSVAQLRSTIASEIRKNINLSDPKVFFISFHYSLIF